VSHGAPWAFDQLAEIETWFAALEPALMANGAQEDQQPERRASG
jgi:hypothetical protein